MYLNEGFEPLHDKIISFSDQTKDSEIEVALQWKNEDDVTVKSFANNIHTLEGGTHEEGLRTAVTKAINDFAKKRNLHSDISLTGDDISCLLYTSPSPRDVEESRMPSSA